MKILLLGASGRTGSRVLKSALEQGYEVHALLRNSSRLSPQKSLSVFEGNPTDAADLEQAMEGCEAVVNVLNISRQSDFPWARLRTPKSFLENVMQELISACEKHGIKRVVICSAWGVAETREHIPGWFRWIIDNSNVGAAYAGHEQQEELLSSSSLDWTIVRPVGLTNSKKAENVRLSKVNKPKPSMMISRQTVANYLLDALNNNTLIGQKVVISRD